ncbi:MAG: peptidylprolyl isomerase, partial [Acidobacteriota bacterium]|nr:peptidylprolyl isomerase [Acidobacteriota bacterium]
LKDPALLKPQTTTKEEVAGHKKNRFMKIIPRPGGKVDASVPSGPASTPTTTPTPQTPAK